MIIGLLTELLIGLISSALTLSGAALIYLARKEKFSGYRVVVRKEDEVLCERLVGHRKAEEILDDLTSLSVFLKGVVSPFCWINEDLLSEKASKAGLLTFLPHQKAWSIDISKNPPKKEKRRQCI